MMSFRSLIFREFRLSIKAIVLQTGLLLAWIALAWGILLSGNSNGLTGDELLGVTDTIFIMTALIGSMSLLLDENFKSDINSGWLGYSYALPIKPLERAAARFVRRYSVCIVSLLIGLCNGAALCAYTGKEFGVNQIVWIIAVFAAVILNSLTNDIFVLRARSAADLKKMNTLSGLVYTALLFVIVFVIFKASGIDLEKIAESDTLMKLPVFTAKSLAWAVPLLLAMMAASFFTSYFSMRSAYSNNIKSEKENNEINRISLPEKTDGTTGLLYKELKQNRLVLILTAVTPILLTAFPFCFSAIDAITGRAGAAEVFETATNVIIRVLMCAMGIFIVSGLMSEVFHGDDKKLWAYFVVSAPQGVRGFLYNKYVVTLMVNLIYFISGLFAETLLATVNYFVTGNELAANMQSIYILGVFLLMAVSALDIPFTVRYGSKRGSIVKMIVMLSISAAAVGVFSLLPDDISAKLTETIVSIFNGEGANDILMLILSFFPYIAFAAFLFSYKIACGVFLKGVNEYDK